jgi:hypothetical protein
MVILFKMALKVQKFNQSPTLKNFAILIDFSKKINQIFLNIHDLPEICKLNIAIPRFGSFSDVLETVIS